MFSPGSIATEEETKRLAKRSALAKEIVLDAVRALEAVRHLP